MPSFTQYSALPYTDIAETLFLGGTVKTSQTALGFVTRSGTYTVTVRGTGLTYDANGTLTGGTLTGYSIKELQGGTDVGVLFVDSNFTLLSFSELNQVFALAEASDLSGAVAQVTASWTAEFFWHTNYSGGYLHGYAGNEALFSGSLADQVYGFDGNDTIVLGGGADGGFGGTGGDHISGDAGDDTIYGGDGSDSLSGGDGNDQIYDSSGANYLSGGTGNDLLYGGTGSDIATGDQGTDILDGGFGDDTLSGGADGDGIEGGAGNDQLSGDHGDDVLAGGNGNDGLRGNTGDDQLHGGAGNDRISGGTGSDILSGGAGRDIFLFAAAVASQDTILDFEDNVDVIRLFGFGYQDAAAALAMATEQAGSVMFDLGQGQSLTVLGATLVSLSDDLLV